MTVFAAQEAAVDALRMTLAGLAILAAFQWWKDRPRSATLTLLIAALLASFFWLAQVVVPFGFGTDAAATEIWAQAGVNAAGRSDEGYVAGTAAKRSLIALLAAAGLPRRALHHVPQVAALSMTFFAWFSASALRSSKQTRWFARALALSGGVFPGVVGQGASLANPAVALAMLLIGSGALVALRFRSRRRAVVTALLVGMTALGTGIASVWGLCLAAIAAILATVALSPLLRVTCRRLSRNAGNRRRLEAIVIGWVFAGGGLFWWSPPDSLSGFPAARTEGSTLKRPLEWITANVPADEVVISSPDYASSIAALAGRRVLFGPQTHPVQPDLPEPFRRARLYASVVEGRPVLALATAFRTTHLLLGPGEDLQPHGDSTLLQGRGTLELAYEDAKNFRVYRIVTK